MSALQGRNRLRVIGGDWRGRKLQFPDVAGLRPTADRIRETLFNWVAPIVPGAVCLDLFAGSGALGLEALSRGAAQTVFVERDRRAAAALRDNLALLRCERGRVVESSAERYLAGPPTPFGLVFLDPPFRQGLLAPTLARLAADGWLLPGARLYIETEAEGGEPTLAPGWELLRSRSAGQVAYHLAVAPG